MCGIAGLRNLKQDKGDGEGWPVDQGSDHSNPIVSFIQLEGIVIQVIAQGDR
jgi:hypothetical protein